MNDHDAAAKLDRLLQNVLRDSRLDLTYTLDTPTLETPDPASRPRIAVEFEGADANMLTERNGELLLALEHIAAKALRLEPEEHDLIRFEAGGFKANRERNLQRAAEAALRQVRATGQPYAFAPMSSHERRLLHLALAPSGLPTESKGESPQRRLVLYPATAKMHP